MTGRRDVLRGVGTAAALLATAGCLETPGGADGDTPTGTQAGTTTQSGGGTTTGTTTGGTTTAGTTTGGNVVDVQAGPEGRLRFVPEDVDVSVGDTVRWTFLSPGHNVTSKPGADPKCKNPSGAEPFASYEGDAHYSVDPEGSTYEHTFTVPGEYVYVCAPHADQGMVGTVTVTE